MDDTAVWRARNTVFSLRDPLVMGILNVTPDSFSDGGDHIDPHVAVDAGLDMHRAGAAIVDVGGESTRPYAEPVDLDTELARVVPVVAGLAERGVAVSVDTSKPEVALAALDAGACVVNDVTGLRDPRMVEVCADMQAGVVIMHMQGDPGTMQDHPEYGDVVVEVGRFLADQAIRAVEAGVALESVAIDPGIGFGKTLEHNLDLLGNVAALTHFGYPVLVGPSRKGFLGTLLEPVRGPTEARDRDGATAAVVALAVANGANIVRVHNVALGVEVATIAKAMVRKEHHEQEIDGT
ncbi:MAG: dihydropteroate synthase [Acidimicrobiia bacterium]|nr:dihydropteroate synthase [Acidimicrobiia bacterium]